MPYNRYSIPATGYDLKLDKIDVDRYLPPARSGEAPNEIGVENTDEFPVDTLNDFDVDGQILIGSLKVKNLNVTDIDVTITAKNGVMHVLPLTANLCDGTYSGNIQINAANAQPTLSVDETLKDVQADPLHKDLHGDAHLTDTGNLQAKLTTIGINASSMK